MVPRVFIAKAKPGMTAVAVLEKSSGDWENGAEQKTWDADQEGDEAAFRDQRRRQFSPARRLISRTRWGRDGNNWRANAVKEARRSWRIPKPARSSDS